MSQELIAQFNQEKRSMTAKLQAAQQMYTDMSNICEQLRISLNLMRPQLDEANQEIAMLKEKVKELTCNDAA